MEVTPEPKSRRPILVGALAALAAGLISAVLLLVLGQPGKGPPPASEGGLVVEAGPRAEARLSPGVRLRCYVAGRLVGDLPLEECARRNGVASGALDVGLDSSGVLGAGGAVLTPLPPQEAPAPVEVLAPAEPASAASLPAVGPPLAACWGYAGAEWRRLPGEMTQIACVQTLFSGTCERQGEAAYGRWGGQTLRLVPGRVEVSADNRSFRLLVEQGPNCGFPAG
ncbi:MAG: hypothetical protein IM617_12485 [Phenylobacterium sp.]|jgi:hypothetical protein|nr:hypothetical protein [Phenylobacterium sp.]MCA6311583.1 hypothetical protein [Phenylobacterium sp.]MCA6340263.1 hypothetical protein [Phenylobacterium sp.]MCA6343763.1 hypothetical protein [Phenylobacterium sp.]MCA6345917.1 hypothetical protein [Phenylobacterium sp.]MCA6348851.1 hypothetical protein [Phenylobacterium sp.]